MGNIRYADEYRKAKGPRLGVVRLYGLVGPPTSPLGYHNHYTPLLNDNN